MIYINDYEDYHNFDIQVVDANIRLYYNKILP